MIYKCELLKVEKKENPLLPCLLLSQLLLYPINSLMEVEHYTEKENSSYSNVIDISFLVF